MSKQIQVIVASLPETRERVKNRLKELGLKDVASKEYSCQKCDGNCFISNGTYTGASKSAKEENMHLMILCETCAGKHMSGNLKLEVCQETLDELSDTFNSK